MERALDDKSLQCKRRSEAEEALREQVAEERAAFAERLSVARATHENEFKEYKLRKIEEMDAVYAKFQVRCTQLGLGATGGCLQI